MKKDPLEEYIFNIIGYSGMAKYYASEAIKSAKNGEFEESNEFLKKSDEEFSKAQDAEGALAKLRDKESKKCGELILIHSQDHFMGTMTYRELAKEMIDMCKKYSDIEKNLIERIEKLEKGQ